jgi:hypothetical protein
MSCAAASVRAADRIETPHNMEIKLMICKIQIIKSSSHMHTHCCQEKDMVVALNLINWESQNTYQLGVYH